MTVTVATLGFPRIGARRELKTALERHWAGETDAAALIEAGRALRARAWARQRDLGCDHVPSNDFSFYDQMLDASAMLGVVPERFGWDGWPVDLGLYFAMARGRTATVEDDDCGCGHPHAPAAAACEMTKWFDTNYHYLVPELAAGQRFRLGSNKPVEEFLEAKAQGVVTRPVLIGPVTWLKLAKGAGVAPLSLLEGVLPVYGEVLRRLAAAGAEWVQMDEPALVLDLSDEERAAYVRAYGELAQAAPGLKLMLTPYFGALGDNLATALSLPVAGLHLDLVRGGHELEAVLAQARPDLVLELGVIDGRNVWRADLAALLDRLEPVAATGRPLILATSCSLLHTPIDVEAETGLDPEVRRWLAFAAQKVEELSTLARALNHGRNAVRESLQASTAAARARLRSPRIHDPAVRARLAAVTPQMARRATPVAERRAKQHERLALPAFPTTTIGSFPQTAEVRKARAAHARGATTDADYDAFLRRETEGAIRWQEETGLDVLVHGEFERNDMVQYFGEQLAGFAFTVHGWVQSYGSRCVRPPILYGDVSRPAPMTVDWWRYAQGLTARPVKGMLTGPVTILNWSFVRDDIPRSDACAQIALAIRDEVADLEAAGAAIIQIDEAAIREGLPLRQAERAGYLDWAVTAFRLTASGVADETQVHTHMCYSEFGDMLEAIGAMDADVISIETARSHMELLEAFGAYRYPGEIGPGVYDIHSPRVPDVREMTGLLARAAERLPPDRLWVNPDCGLKTRAWDEVRPAIANMVVAALAARAALA
jgi:5-methyltetrahydropteroyltriglutamate--homocysteine methyltransferase